MARIWGLSFSGFIAWVMWLVVVGGYALVVLLGLRNWIFFKLGIRNFPRRRARTALIVVGLANPVGIARLVRTVGLLGSRPDPPDTVALVNRVGSGSVRRQEIRAETARLLPTIPVILLVIFRPQGIFGDRD